MYSSNFQTHTVGAFIVLRIFFGQRRPCNRIANGSDVGEQLAKKDTDLTPKQIRSCKHTIDNCNTGEQLASKDTALLSKPKPTFDVSVHHIEVVETAESCEACFSAKLSSFLLAPP